MTAAEDTDRAVLDAFRHLADASLLHDADQARAASDELNRLIPSQRSDDALVEQPPTL